jgi:hypothetical protein
MTLFDEILEAAKKLSVALDKTDDTLCTRTYLNFEAPDKCEKLTELLGLASKLRHNLYWIKQEIRQELGE